MSQIVWLASYPKSGNTWLRALFSNFHEASGAPVSIDSFMASDAASRQLFDSALGLESADMTQDEIDHYRPRVYREIAFRSRELLFLKIHDAYTRPLRGEATIPADATAGAIYLVRNPLDVAISFAHHSSISIDAAIDRMADEAFAFCSRPDRWHRQFRQKLLSWSHHVLSWLDQDAFAVHVIRYEYMHAQPLDAFEGALRFLGMEVNTDRVARAVSFSTFPALQAQERSNGFRERPSGAKAFFRSGRVGQWQDILTAEQVARVVRNHGDVMQRLGYLSENGVVEVPATKLA